MKTKPSPFGSTRAFPALLALTLGCCILTVSAQPTVDFLLTNRLAEPHSVTVDENNKFYITDSADHRVLKYDPDNGALTSLAGVSGQFGTNNGPGFVARFFSPRGAIIARNGLVVADSGNHSLRFLSLTGSVSIVTNFAGTPSSAGLVDGPAATARFNNPISLAADAAGNIYVADSKNNAVRKVDLNNVVSTIATNFAEPSAVAVGESGELYVADTRNHAIKIIRTDGTVSLLAGRNLATGSGTNDSFFADEALFSSPSGLLWLGGSTGLLVSDTGNHTLRRIYFDPIVASFFPEKNGYSVETYAGIPRQSGFQDGVLNAAKFNSPAGLARDFDNGLLIVDLGNAALRRIQTTPRLPRISNPKIGFVIFVVDKETGALVSRLVPFTEAVFNNDLIIAILGEDRTDTLYTTGATPGLFEADTIPVPNSINSQPAPPYADGLPPNQVKPSILEPRPDLTVKALSSAEGRRPSDVVQARIQFKVATPVILGDNPASFVLTNDTVGADMWYTLDGSSPTNEPPSIQATGDTLSLRITEPVVFRARGFKRNYKLSEITTKTFSPNDFQANRISFGFERGEASSQFFGSAGQTFIAPVTLSLLPSQKIFSMQFNLTVTNVGAALSVAPGAIGFRSMIFEQMPDTSFRRIDPKMFERNDIEILTNNVPQGILITTNFIEIFRDLLFTNLSQNLLGVGWLEIVGLTNLYNTKIQDLVTYSFAHDRLFLGSSGRAVLGGYSFQIPAQATSNSKYRIQIGRASGIENAFSKDVFIDAPTNGSLAGGAVNALKDITVVNGGLGAGQLHYIVGDSLPFRWYNAGDFGDTNILSHDIFQVFQAGTYGFNIPPLGTDFFDAMDSCCLGPSGSVLTNIFDGNVTDINQITHGNGALDVTDVFVTFRRSLDPTLKWYARYWENGQRVAAEVPNRFRGGLNSVTGNSTLSQANSPSEKLISGASSEPPSVAFYAEDLRIAPGETLFVPIRADVSGRYPVRVLMLGVSVEPIDGSAPLSEPVAFTPVPHLGKPALTTTRGLAGYAAAWLDHKVTGLSGSALVGMLRVAIPPQAKPDAAYRIHFDHVSASPNGFARLPQQVSDALLTMTDRSSSSYRDGIPDTWRLRHFGSLLNYLVHADADADGDGVPNWAEHKAGTHPNDVQSHLRMLAQRNPGIAPTAQPELTLRWPSVRNKVYAIEMARNIADVEWLPLAGNIAGTGSEMQFTVTPTTDAGQFYRVRLVE